MDVIREIPALRTAVSRHRAAGRRIVLVPTMGALHDGHRSCVDAGRAVENAFLVVSIFVNPTQFAPGEDLAAYPRGLERDLGLCRDWGVGAVFAPDERDVYPTPQRAWVDVEGISGVMCGRFRPGHFRGVATVVAKLLHMVEPDVAVFGQKDAQQALVIRAMVRQLDMRVELRLARTVRDPDGLALSSRNAYLDAAERGRAGAISAALRRAGERIERGERDARRLEAAVVADLAEAGIDDVDYAELRSADDLSALDAIRGRVILAIAARVGRTRLIDNVVFDVGAGGVAVDVALFPGAETE